MIYVSCVSSNACDDVFYVSKNKVFINLDIILIYYKVFINLDIILIYYIHASFSHLVMLHTIIITGSCII